jgi:hypothetical protein
VGPEGGRPDRHTQAVSYTSSGKLGIAKILRYVRSHMYTHCLFNILEAIIYYQKPQPTQRCLTQVT